MYEQPAQDNILLYMLYAAGTTMALIASCYLLFRRGNAFAPDLKTPDRLRRLTAAFFACMALAHIWYLPIVFLTTSEAVKLNYFIGGLLDMMTIFPLAILISFSMLQDHKRSHWPVIVMIAPLVLGIAWCIFSRSDDLLPILYIYALLLAIGLFVYMIREVRRYGRWLRDNYADLEHKEVRQSFVVLAIILLFLFYYTSGLGGPYYKYLVQVCSMVLICYLLWRVETLSDLSIPESLSISPEEDTTVEEKPEENDHSQDTHDDMDLLLQRFCIDTQLYLQHDLTLQQLAKAIGTNRTYLSNYFSRHGLTYNTYINDLRINHFVNLYHDTIAAQRNISVQQLVCDSGYRSYSTFSLAFKRRMNQNVTTWMHAQ